MCSCSTADRLGTATGSEAAGDIYAKDQLDLQRVGPLIERSHSPQELETYLNADDGINNLDLNGDGYTDYLSVQEFDDQGPYARGLSVYDCFGPGQIQDVATVYFYRDDPAWTGSRVLVVGDDNIYGDNVYYQSNWYDRPLDLISFVFGPHDVYRSPYYYNNYPSDYVAYDVVTTPVYTARVQRLYPDPVLVYTQQRPQFMDKIRIKSPNEGRHFDQVFAKLAKPTREQQRFLAENHPRPDHAAKMREGRSESQPQPERGRGDEKAQGGKPQREQDQRVAEMPGGRQDQRVTRGREARPQERAPQTAKNQPRENRTPPRFNRPAPQVRSAPQGRPAPQVRQNPQGGGRPPEQKAQHGPPAGKQGPPAQHGGGGGKKKG